MVTKHLLSTYCEPTGTEAAITEKRGSLVLLSEASLKAREGLELFPGTVVVGKRETFTRISPRSKLLGSV